MTKMVCWNEIMYWAFLANPIQHTTVVYNLSFRRKQIYEHHAFFRIFYIYLFTMFLLFIPRAFLWLFFLLILKFALYMHVYMRPSVVHMSVTLPSLNNLKFCRLSLYDIERSMLLLDFSLVYIWQSLWKLIYMYFERWLTHSAYNSCHIFGGLILNNAGCFSMTRRFRMRFQKFHCAIFKSYSCFDFSQTSNDMWLVVPYFGTLGIK